MKAISKIIATVCLATFSFSADAQEVEKSTQIKPIKTASITPKITGSRSTKSATKQVQIQRPVRKIVSPEKQMMKVDPIKQ